MSTQKYVNVRQHEPLRVPQNWTGESRALVIQLESLLDELYRRIGDAERRLKALEEEE